MLINDISTSIKQLKQLDVLESAVQDAKKKAKNNADFATLVTDFSSAMSKLAKANSELGYFLEPETLQLVKDAIDKVEGVIASGTVDETELSYAKQHITRKVNPNLSKEWSSFHSKKTLGTIGRLATIGSLVSYPNKVVSIKTNIDNGKSWEGLSFVEDGKHTRLDLLRDSISEVDNLVDGLNLSPEVTEFLLLVSQGKAKVGDLSENIISWINSENLNDMFAIHFRS